MNGRGGDWDDGSEEERMRIGREEEERTEGDRLGISEGNINKYM